MRGHIRLRESGSWQIAIYRGVEGGKRKYDYYLVEGTKKDAEAKLASLVNDKHRGAYVKPSKETLAKFLAGWLEVIATETAVRTHERYSEIVNKHLVPAFGTCRLETLTPDMVQQYKVRALKTGRLDGKGGLSPQTVTHHLRVLHAALEYAVAQDKLARNPADSKRVKAPTVPPRDMQTLDAEDALQLLEAARREAPKLYVPVLLAITAGLRRGEIMGLRWSDIDLDAGMLAVQQTVQETRTQGLVFKSTKTRGSRRTVELLPMTISALRQHQERQARDRKVIGLRPDRSALVCSEADSTPIRPLYVTQAFAKLVRRTAGLPWIRFHDLRHGYASLMLKLGVQPKVVSEALGHSKIGITMDLYSHVGPTMQKEAARRLQEEFERAASRKTNRA